MTGPVLYSDSGRQQKCSQSSSSLIIPGITSAQLLPPVETSEASHASQLPLLSVEATPSASAASGPSRPQQIPKDAATEGAAERPRLDTSAQSLALRLPSWELLPPTVAVL